MSFVTLSARAMRSRDGVVVFDFSHIDIAETDSSSSDAFIAIVGNTAAADEGEAGAVMRKRRKLSLGSLLGPPGLTCLRRTACPTSGRNEWTKEAKEMTPRRLIRWKSFWLGILVLGFLGWAWVSGMTDGRAVSLTRGEYYFVLDSGKGELVFSFGYDPFSKGDGFSVDSSHWEDYPWMADAVEMDKWPEGGSITLAYWFLILLFIIPWASFLAWRWRRQRILTKAHDAAPAH